MFLKYIIYLFLAALSLCCCTWRPTGEQRGFREMRRRKSVRNAGRSTKQESQNEARENLDCEDVYEFGYRPQKTLGKKKKHTISLRMNEIPGAHLETVFSLSIQSYYKWFCTENCFKHMTGPCSRYQFQSADSQVRLLGYNTQTHC